MFTLVKRAWIPLVVVVAVAVGAIFAWHGPRLREGRDGEEQEQRDRAE